MLNRLQLIIGNAVLFFILLSVLSCSGAETNLASIDDPAVGNNTDVDLHEGEITDNLNYEPKIQTVEEILKELDSLEVPEGVDGELFQELKDTFRVALIQQGNSKFTSAPPNKKIEDLRVWRDQPGNQDYMMSWTYENTGDYDLNSDVNVSDLTPIAIYFQATTSSPNWSKAKVADGDGNGEINLADIAPIAIHYQSSVASYRIEGSFADGGNIWTQIETVKSVDIVKDDPANDVEYELNMPAYDKYRVVPYDLSQNEGMASEPDNVVELAESAILVGPESGFIFDKYFEGWYYLEVEGAEDTISGESIVFGQGDIGTNEYGFIIDVEEVDYVNSKLVKFRGSSVDPDDAIIDGYWDLVLPVRGTGQGGGGSIVKAVSSKNKGVSAVGDPIEIDLSGELYSDDYLTVSLVDSSLSIQPDISLTVDKFLEVPYAIKATAAGDIDININVVAEVDVESEYKPDPVKLPSPPPIPWAFGPIFGDVIVNVYAGVEAYGHLNVHATTGFDAGASFSNLGAEWSELSFPKWKSTFPVCTDQYVTYHPLELIATADGYVQVYLIVELQPRVWGVGPKLAVKPYMQLDVEASYPPLAGSADLSWGADASVDFEFDLFFLHFGYEDNFTLIEKELIKHWDYNPPTAVLTASPTSGNAPLEVTLDASGSTDSDGTIVLYEWDWDGGGNGPWDSSGASSSIFHTYSTEGTYTAWVRVTDNAGLTDNQSVTITVNDGNQAPTAVLNANPTSGNAPLVVTFDASGSSDPDGPIVLYEWDWDGGGSGPWDDSGTSSTSQHTYSTEGVYTAWVRVTDNEGATDTDFVGITGNIPDNVPPTADISADPTSGNAPLDVTLNASSSTDSDGTIVLYEWDWDGGGSGPWDESGASSSTSHTYSEGTYTAWVRVTDNGGATDTASVGILCGPEPPPAGWAKSWKWDNGSCSAEDGAEDSLGNVYVVGYVNETGQPEDEREAAILKYNSEGSLLWSRAWGVAKSDFARGVAVDAADNVYVVGNTSHTIGRQGNVLILKLDPTGSTIWERVWDSYQGGAPLDYSERAFDVAVDNSGNVYVTGESNIRGGGANANDIFLLKYNSVGSLQWQRAWGGTGEDNGYGVCVDPSGNIYVAGRTFNWGAGSTAACLLKYTSSGTLSWQKVWGESSYDEAYGVTADSAGNVYITGYTGSFGNGSQVIVVKFNSSGSVLWEKEYGGSSSEIGRAITFCNGELYTTGKTSDGNHLLLLRMDLNGALLDQKKWSQTNSDGYGIAATSSGSVIVCGAGVYSAGWQDMSNTMQDAPGIVQNAGSTNFTVSGETYNLNEGTYSMTGTVDGPSAGMLAVKWDFSS